MRHGAAGAGGEREEIVGLSPLSGDQTLASRGSGTA